MRKTSVSRSPLRPDSSGSSPLDLIPFAYPQPHPYSVRVVTYRTKKTVSTSIVRLWHDGEPERCRLCRECTADHGACLIVIPQYISREDAALLSVVDRRRLKGSVELGLIGGES